MLPGLTKKVILYLTKMERLSEKVRNLWFVKELRRRIPEGEVYIVGGIIRDALLGRNSEDLDLVIRRVPAEILKRQLQALGKVELVGTTFGVFKFIPRGEREAIDIALPRREVSTGEGGYREFEVQYQKDLPIEEDLQRRDFTINAMALDIESGRIIDPFLGMNNLKKREIRTVGDPSERFSEDYSRILRALRFACQLGFRIEERTFEAIQKYGFKILERKLFGQKERTIVPWEMISQEFLKGFEAAPVKLIELYDSVGLLRLILPEIEALKGVEQPAEFHTEGDCYIHTKLALTKLSSPASMRLKLATLFHDVGKSKTQKTPERNGTSRIRFDEHDRIGAELTKGICKRLRFSRRLSENVVWLVKYHMLFLSSSVFEMKPQTLKKYFFENPELGGDLLELYRIDVLASPNKDLEKNLRDWEESKEYIERMYQFFEEKEKLAPLKHIISGHDIMGGFGLLPGPLVGKYLREATNFVLERIAQGKEKPGKEEILEHLRGLKLEN